MRDIFGKIVSGMLPFVVLLGVCMAIAVIFSPLADKMLEKQRAKEAQNTATEQIDASGTDSGSSSKDSNSASDNTSNDNASNDNASNGNASNGNASNGNASNGNASNDNASGEVNGISSGALKLEDIDSYGVFIGETPERLSYIEGYDLVVIDAQYFEGSDIAKLKETGTQKVYSYLNVGSLENFRDYYFLYENLTLADYENQPGERWINVADPAWGGFIDQLADELLEKGVDGFFIDNCDVYGKFRTEDIFSGLQTVLADVKNKKIVSGDGTSVGCGVIVNGGSEFLLECINRGIRISNYADAVNQESVYTRVRYTEGGNAVFEAAKEADREYFTEYLESVKKEGIGALVVEYSDSEGLTQIAEKYAAGNNWKLYVSDNLELNAEGAQIEAWIKKHSIEEKVAQLFIVTPEAINGLVKDEGSLAIDSGARGYITEFGQLLSDGIDNCPVGGFIFFGKNLEGRDQTIALLENISSFYEERNMPSPFLAVDEEGGLVARIGNNPNFDVDSTVPMSEIGATGDVAYAYEAGSYIGSYLSELGFNMNMAPDADVLSNPDNKVIGNRSFGSDAQLVSDMVMAESRALNEKGITLVIKHFPGHGSTEADSHNGYAYTDKTLEELMECELIPFSDSAKDGVGAIMVGHISVPNITGDDIPSSLSAYMVNQVLRGKLGFDGIVITDSMSMGAVTKQYGSAEAAVMALEAGCDIILMPESFVEAYEGIINAVNNGTISEERINQSVRRILRVKNL